jgi:hypothetical protein
MQEPRSTSIEHQRQLSGAVIVDDAHWLQTLYSMHAEPDEGVGWGVGWGVGAIVVVVVVVVDIVVAAVDDVVGAVVVVVVVVEVVGNGVGNCVVDIGVG